jgi:RNA polymerase sigma-70 factor (ECF subfamily)
VDDRELIARVLAGEATAERALYDRHVDRVYRLAYRLAGDPDLAMDFTQDTFIRAFDRLASYRGDAAFSTWLTAVATSVALNGLQPFSGSGKRTSSMATKARSGPLNPISRNGCPGKLTGSPWATGWCS